MLSLIVNIDLISPCVIPNGVGVHTQSVYTIYQVFYRREFVFSYMRSPHTHKHTHRVEAQPGMGAGY